MVYICDNLNNKVFNSDSLSGGWVTYVSSPFFMNDGYRYPQGIIALKNEYKADSYFLVHTFLDSTPGTQGVDLMVSDILYTVLERNNLEWIVTTKNQSLLHGDLGGEIICTRHANGKDWWFIFQDRDSECFRIVLLDSTGFKVMPYESCYGVSIPHGQIGTACFSPNGRRFTYSSLDGPIKLFDFDRCIGKLENGTVIPVSSSVSGLSFSPSGRFLYVSATTLMLQFDTWATDIVASVDTVGIYDGYYLNGSPIFQGSFGYAQLAPNGRIYFNSGSLDVYHVINQPDEEGVACDFQQHGVKLPSLTIGIPNYPNYRLGALPGSACDTITSIKDIAEKEKILKVFPNPATDVATIDYGYTDWSKGEATMEIANSLGQTVHSQMLPMYSGFQKLQVGNYPSGSYTVYIKRKGNIVATGRLVKE